MSGVSVRPFDADLGEIYTRALPDLKALDGAHLLITGGTGFVGTWLVESAMWACEHGSIDLRLTVLSRAPQSFLDLRPHLVTPRLRFVASDIREGLSHVEPADGIIHAATEPISPAADPSTMLAVITEGARNVLGFATQRRNTRVLMTSSGAVYGEQPADLALVSETYLGAPDVLSPAVAYHEGKRVAELLGAIAAAEHGLTFVPARLFSFLGPFLPLAGHFAAGNFLHDALNHRSIEIGGDGSPVRSYMHPVDLAVWMWALLARGEGQRAYNVGSEHGVSIAELAALIDVSAGGNGVHINGRSSGLPPQRYVPSTERIRSELGVALRIPLDDAIERTLAWHRHIGSR